MLIQKTRLIVLLGLALLCSGLAVGQTNATEPTTWTKLEDAASLLIEEEKYDEALALLNQTAPQLSDREFEVTDLRMSILFNAQRFSQAYDAWEKGLDEEYFFFVVPRMGTYDAIRNDERFETALARNNQLREKTNNDSKPEYKVITPTAYSQNESYPLLMVIHGGNQSIVKAMQTWDPQVIGDDLIIAYAQSSMRADSKSYRWNLNGVDFYHLPTAQDEVLGLYQAIVNKYPVDTEQVILVGFSQGGNLALNMATEGSIPAMGFIAGCPAIRNPISPQAAQNAADRGLRGTIFVGANDWTANASQTTVDNFADAGLSVNHIVMEGKGHEYPDNFEEVLRDAIKSIRQ